MYFAIVSVEGKYLRGASQGELVWGSLNEAAVYPEESKHLWSRLNRSTPSIDELLIQKRVALVPHPNYKFCGVEHGHAVYEVLGDSNYRVLAGALFPQDRELEEPKVEEESFEFTCL